MEGLRQNNLTDLVSFEPRSTASFLEASQQNSSLNPGGDIRGAIYGFACVSLTITTITTALRLFTKFHYLKVRQWDDYLMLASWCGIVCMWAFILLSVNYGAGIDVRNVSLSEGPDFQKYALLHGLFYAITQCLLKTSIALQILHIFVPNPHIRTNRTYKFWIVVIFTALQNAWYFTFFWVALFQCTPVQKEFNYTTVEGHCISGWDAYNIVVSSWNMVADISMFVFPMVCVWNVQMRWKPKLEAASVFLLGALAITSSCLRLVFTIRRFHTTDYTLVLTQIALCDTGEITAGILVGNSVPLPRLFHEIIDKLRRKRHPELYRIRGTPSTATIATTATSAGTNIGSSLDSGRCMSSRNTPFGIVRNGVGPRRNYSDVSSLMTSFEELLQTDRRVES